MATFYKVSGITKRYTSWALFLSYHHYSNTSTNAWYVDYVHIFKQDDSSAIVRLYLPDGVLQFDFADYNVAVEYFTKRSYRFRSIPHRIY